MASGKRASMREGPLSALFRKTEDDGLEDVAEPADPVAARQAPPPEEPARPEPPAAPPAPAEPRVPTPQERLRHAFSSELPENMMAPPPAPPPSAADYQWGSVPQES